MAEMTPDSDQGRSQAIFGSTHIASPGAVWHLTKGKKTYSYFIISMVFLFLHIDLGTFPQYLDFLCKTTARTRFSVQSTPVTLTLSRQD